MTLRRLAMPSIRWMFNSKQWRASKSEWMRAAQCLQPEEKERIGKFMFKRDAKSSMIGRLMLRKLIHDVTILPYAEITLSRTDKGKPFLQNDLPASCPRLSFNVSHQGEYVVLAAETDFEVGIDVMNCETPRAKSIADFFHTMRRQFTETEWRSIKSHRKEEDQLKTFYRLWCLKESYVKALGIGIGFEVQRLNFTLHTPHLEPSTTVSSTTLTVDGEDMVDCTAVSSTTLTVDGEDMVDCTTVSSTTLTVDGEDLVDCTTVSSTTLTVDGEDLVDCTTVSSTTLTVDGEDMVDWTFEETCHNNHCVAVAVNKQREIASEKDNSTFSLLKFEELLRDSSPLSEPDDHYGDQFIQKDEDPFTLKNKSPS